MLYGSNDEKENTIQTKCEKLITQLEDEMAEHPKSVCIIQWSMSILTHTR